MPLTPRQDAVLRAIERLTAQMGYPPTSKEIASYSGMSETRVRQHLDALQSRKAISRQINKPRTLRVLAPCE